MTIQRNNPFAGLYDTAGRATNSYGSSNVPTRYGTLQNIENVKITKKWTVHDLNRIVKNGIQGLDDPTRNCSMCCLNALASNINALYAGYSPKSIPTNNTMIQATETLVKKGYAVRLKDIQPTIKNTTKRFTTAADILDNDVEKSVSANISASLSKLTPDNSLMFFSVGIAYGYHSTIIAVSKISTLSVGGGGIRLSGNNNKPLFLFIEDNGGARKYYGPELDAKCCQYIVGATRHYRGRNNLNANLDAIIFQLNIPNK
ncbi:MULTISPECIES: hypothetical protein [unclassified Acinetobacter]|uniref:hypothetical protein n=1 Tax=unclassified Acinetobacter TaxID=196816 RepID=UPI0015D2C923|nr:MULTISPECIES: hypothetical protein [unclassified Acinetobacter]UUS60506.1 hypothetical protein MST17_14360 [Acinetobacter sp. YH16056_T]